MQQQPAYLNPHQARDREPDDYQNLLGDAIERAYAAGVHDSPAWWRASTRWPCRRRTASRGAWSCSSAR